MSNQSITLKGGIRLCLKNEGKAIMVIDNGLKMIMRPTLRLVIQQGVSGDNGIDGADGTNGADGTDGVDGAYNSPTPFSVTDGTTYEIPAGKKLDSISVVPESGDRILTVGYGAGDGDIVDNEEVSSDDGASFYVGKYFHTARTLHFSGFDGSVLIYIL